MAEADDDLVPVPAGGRAVRGATSSSHALAPGAHYHDVFRYVGATAFMGFVARAAAADPIWYSRTWSTTFKLMFDGLIYACVWPARSAGCGRRPSSEAVPGEIWSDTVPRHHFSGPSRSADQHAAEHEHPRHEIRRAGQMHRRVRRREVAEQLRHEERREHGRDARDARHRALQLALRLRPGLPRHHALHRRDSRCRRASRSRSPDRSSSPAARARSRGNPPSSAGSPSTIARRSPSFGTTHARQSTHDDHRHDADERQRPAHLPTAPQPNLSCV